MTDKTLKKLLDAVAEDVEAGRSLAASFGERGSKILPVTFIETIRAGEEAGNLDVAFESASEHYTKQIPDIRSGFGCSSSHRADGQSSADVYRDFRLAGTGLAGYYKIVDSGIELLQ